MCMCLGQVGLVLFLRLGLCILPSVCNLLGAFYGHFLHMVFYTMECTLMAHFTLNSSLGVIIGPFTPRNPNDEPKMVEWQN